MEVLGVTHSACEECRRLTPAKSVSDGGDVYFLKFCLEHGEQRRFVRSDAAEYLRALRYVKPAWTPEQFNGDEKQPCIEGCGYCPRHEQHLCLPIVEITSRCDLQCPVWWMPTPCGTSRSTNIGASSTASSPPRNGSTSLICRAALPAETRGVGIPEVVRALGVTPHEFVSADDFLPLPCSHPLCFSLAFYLTLDDGPPVSLKQFLQADALLDAVSNQVFFGLDAGDSERLRELVYELWSGPAAAAPDSEAVLKTLRAILRELSDAPGDPRKVFGVAERRLKSIFIHAFQDVETFDLARARRCCNAYPQPDGRLMPACAHNIFHRGKGAPANEESTHAGQ